MREAQRRQRQQQNRGKERGGGEEEMWHELGVEKKFGPGILRILKALAREQQEGRDGGDGTFDQHEFRTVIRAGVEGASPPADPIGPATLPDIVIKELFFRWDYFQLNRFAAMNRSCGGEGVPRVGCVSTVEALRFNGRSFAFQLLKIRVPTVEALCVVEALYVVEALRGRVRSDGSFLILGGKATQYKHVVCVDRR